jgi:hypothetical protein
MVYLSPPPMGPPDVSASFTIRSPSFVKVQRLALTATKRSLLRRFSDISTVRLVVGRLAQLAQFGSGFRNFAQAGMNEIK